MRALWSLVAATVYLFLPGNSLAPLAGPPLGPLALAVLVCLGLTLFAAWPVRQTRWTRRFGVALLGLCLARLAVGLLSPAYGLEAAYFEESKPGTPPERSTESPRLGATRLDRALDLEGVRFPLYFFNDNQRFNYYKPDEPDRETLPFVARWRGWLHASADSAGERRLWLTAVGIASLRLDGHEIARVETRQQAATQPAIVSLEPGWRPVEVEFTRRGGAPALLQVHWDADGRRQPLAAPSVLAATPVLPEGLLGPLLAAAWAIDSLFLLAAAALVATTIFARHVSPHPRPLPAGEGEKVLPGGEGVRSTLHAPRSTSSRPALALALLALYAYAALTSLPLNDTMTLLDGGADWLTYETYARDIQLNGPLLTQGRPLGRGRPFFFQPFYPYYLAGLHWLTGEDLYGVVVLQLFGQGVAFVLVFYLARRVLGSPAAWLSLAVLLGLLFPLHFEWVGRRLLSENLYFWLLPATALALLQLAEHARVRVAALAGLLLGLCTITRGPTLAWVPLALGVVALELRRQRVPRRAAATPIAVCLLACAAVVALVPLRNYVVSGRPALMATNAGATLALAHPLTGNVRLGKIGEVALYNALNLDRPTREMLEFIRQDPLGYLATLPPLALYSVGLSFAMEGEQGVRYELIALCLLYAASFALPAVRAGPAWVLHTFVGLHLLTMTIFLPNSYGYRQVLPMYLFVAPFAVQALVAAARRLLGGQPEPLPAPRPSQG